MDEVRWDRVAETRRRIVEGYYDRPVVIRLGIRNLLRALTSGCHPNTLGWEDRDCGRRHPELGAERE